MYLRRYRSFQNGTASLWSLVGCKSCNLSKWEISKKSCCTANWAPCAGSPGSSSGRWDHSQSLTDCNFATLWPTETYSTSIERSKPPYYQLIRLAVILGEVLLLKLPHFHNAYLLGVWHSFSDAMYKLLYNFSTNLTVTAIFLTIRLIRHFIDLCIHFYLMSSVNFFFTWGMITKGIVIVLFFS